MTKSLPKKLKKEPIIEAIFEIRFQGSAFASNFLLGNLRAKLGNLPIEKLSISDIPQQIRELNPAMKYAPLFRITWDKYSILIGDRVFAIANNIPYQGWDNFKTKICELMEHISKSNFISNIERYSLKYVDLIEADSLAKQLGLIKIDLQLGGEKILNNAINLRVEIPQDNFIHAVQVVSNGFLETNLGKKRVGIFISIDSISTQTSDNLWEDMSNKLEKIHDSSKKLFFSFLKDETISALEPIYDSE